VGIITFTDAIGSAQIDSLFAGSGTIATRFANWTPMIDPVGDGASAMSSGRVTAFFAFRTEYRVSFEVRNLSVNGPLGSGDNVAKAQRFVAHAKQGGLFRVWPEDDVGTDPTGREAFGSAVLSLADPKQMLYTLSVTATSVTAVPWVAVYGGAR
jgi:hypothetical protein